MLHHPTVDKLHQLRLFGMARALASQEQQADIDRLSFAERLGLLVDCEAAERESRQTKTRLKRARLMSCRWVAEHQNVILCGPTGVGKTYLACALANQACRQGYSALYLRLPRLLSDLAVARGVGRYSKLLVQLARTDVLLLDDWGLAPMTDEGRRDLLEVFDDRHGLRSTVVTSQLPQEHWHDAVGDPTLADAILDRLAHQAHHLALAGESLRRRQKPE